MKPITVRLPQPLVKKVAIEKVKQQRSVQVIVKLALEHYLALPEAKRNLIRKEAA